MDNYKKPLISWLENIKSLYAKQPEILDSVWLSFAQELQRRINDTFRLTACQVNLQYNGIYDSKAVTIEVSRKNNPKDVEFSFFKKVTLISEFNKYRIEIVAQRILLDKFIDSLIKEL